jgi:hypothetical protein
MLGRTNTGGGGGGGLNFKVICNPQPSTAKENTIWIDTDTITSWIFSATEPSPAEPGMVWFTIGTSSTVEFNALKKNGIQVYPIFAKQYVNGAWVDKTAKIYQGSKWVELLSDIFLISKGNLHEDVTGGWSTGWVFTKQADGSYFLQRTSQGYEPLVTKNEIDFTRHSTLRLKYHGFTGTHIDMTVGNNEVSATTNGSGELLLDVSTLYKAVVTINLYANCAVYIDELVLVK